MNTNSSSSLTDEDIKKVGEAMNQSGGQFKYLYASSPEVAMRFKEMYPTIEVIMVPESYLSNDTQAIVTAQKLHG